MGYYYGYTQLGIFETSSPSTPSTSMTQDLTTGVFDIGNADSYAFQFVWTGSPVGTISIMGTLDGVNYNIPIYSIAAGGSDGSLTYDLFGTSVGGVIGTYTFTSGSGTLSAGAAKKFTSGSGTLASSLL